MWIEHYKRMIQASGLLWAGAIFSGLLAFGIGYFLRSGGGGRSKLEGGDGKRD